MTPSELEALRQQYATAALLSKSRGDLLQAIELKLFRPAQALFFAAWLEKERLGRKLHEAEGKIKYLKPSTGRLQKKKSVDEVLASLKPAELAALKLILEKGA